MYLFANFAPASFARGVAAVLAPLVALATTVAEPTATPAQSVATATGVITAVRTAADAYAVAYNAGDSKALGEQWTLGAELEEGGELLKGRQAIVAWLDRSRAIHPQATLKIDVTDVQPLGEGVARVQGTLAFTRQAGEEPLVSRFDSLRVLENGVWRIAQSRVLPTAQRALAELDWMLGTWQSTDGQTGSTIDATYEKSLGGHAIVGRIKTTHKDGSTIESLDLIHADRLTGAVRSWIFDSTGARAEGLLTSDGTSFNRSLVGTPGGGTSGRRAAWVQVLAPLGRDMLLFQSIERTIDGIPIPDTGPVHLRKIH